MGPIALTRDDGPESRVSYRSQRSVGPIISNGSTITLMPTVIWIAVVSFTIVLAASWWLLGSTIPGILIFIIGVAVWLWRWIGRRGRSE
jgi:hypothetical protein